MNERIKLLAEQTGYRYDNGEWQFADDSDIEKFAELIVKECAELIDNKVMITAAQTYDEVFVAKYDTKEQCAQQIKDHFGVEE